MTDQRAPSYLLCQTSHPSADQLSTTHWIIPRLDHVRSAIMYRHRELILIRLCAAYIGACVLRTLNELLIFPAATGISAEVLYAHLDAVISPT